MENLLQCAFRDPSSLPLVWSASLVRSQCAFLFQLCDYIHRLVHEPQLVVDILGVLYSSRLVELENEIESTFDNEIGLGAGIELLNDNIEFCSDCLSNLLRWLVDCGCDLDASAYHRGEQIVRRRRLSADTFFLRFDVFRHVFRIDRAHFVELSELLLPGVEYVRCANGTCAERLEAIMLVFMRLTRPRSQVL